MNPTWWRALACALALVLLHAPSVARAQAQPDFSRVVSLGDSLLDDPGKRRSPLIPEHITRRLGVGLTQLARGGSTTATLLSQQQHTRAVSMGATFAFVWIGGNDFLANQGAILQGNFAFLDTAQANLETALDTLIAGGVTDIVFFNLPDLSVVPAVLNGIMALPAESRPAILANFQAASAQWAQRLRGVATARGILLIDIFTMAQVAAAMPEMFPILGRSLIPAPASGNLSTCQFCAFADPIHPASATVGLTTNFTIQAMNSFFGTSIPLLSQAELDQLVLDADTDIINNVADNCAMRANADQRNTGGVAGPADPMGALPDRIGDVCQCGDADGDGRVTGVDATILTRCALGLSPCGAAGLAALPGGSEKCGTGGAPGCDAAEAVIVRRATLGLAPGIQQQCPAATGAR